MNYYKRTAMLKKGITPSSLARWSRALRGTSMVMKTKDTKELAYSEDCVTFLLSRKDNTGPSNLPEPERIAALYEWVREDQTVEQIAAGLGVSSLVIEMQLKAIGAME